MVDGQLDLGTDPHTVAAEIVQGVRDAAVGGVFQGDQAVIGQPPVDFFEDRTDRADRQKFDRLPETVDGRQVAVAVKGPQEGDPQDLFDRSRTTDDLAKHGPDALFREGTLGQLDGSSQDFFLAARRVNRLAHRVFQLADLVSQPGPLVDQLQNLAVQPVDPLAETRQRRFAARRDRTTDPGFLLLRRLLPGFLPPPAAAAGTGR